MFQHILLRDRSVHLKTSNLQLAIWNMPGDDSEVFWERITYICWIFGFKGCILIWNVNMYACVYVNIKWIIYVHMYIYIFHMLYIHSLSPYYTYTHIYGTNTFWNVECIFVQFHWAGMNQSMLDCTLSLDAFRRRMSNRDQPFHVTWKFGAIRKSHDLRVLHAGGMREIGTQLTPVGRTIH